MRKILPLILLISFVSLFLAGTVLAANAELIEPFVTNVANGGVINLGTIGPGQTIDIVVNGIAIGERGEGRWQILRVVNLPPGWQGFDSKELATRMKAGLKAANNANEGEYKIGFRLEEDPNHQMGLGSVDFQVALTVSRNVVSATFPKQMVDTGVGQPARYSIIIKSKSAANDIFEISAENVSSWEYRKAVHVPAGGTVTTFYEIVANEEKEYNPVIVIKSQSSDDIKISQVLKLAVKSDVVGDIKATKNGVLIFPIVLEPLYSLLGIIGSFI